jgi:hypothetical protein
MQNAWLLLWLGLLAVGVFATIAHVNALRFQERVRREARRRLLGPAPARAIAPEAEAAALPAPVQRYLVLALRDRRRSVRTVRLRHGGRFRPRRDGGWLAIRGEEYFDADPPGFLWWGRARLGPGFWIDARDQIAAGRASLVARFESSIKVAEASGPAIDQGGMQRLLGEMVWFPTAFLDERFVTWEELDDRSALATLSQNGIEASATFHFRRDGLPRLVSAQRYRETKKGPVLTNWSGKFDDYRLVDGMMVPLELEARWHLDSGDWPYAHFKVERIEYDRQDAF